MSPYLIWLNPSHCVSKLTKVNVFYVTPYRCSWVWSCSIGPKRWGLSDIQWRSIPPERSLGCIQSGSRHRRRSCFPCGGRFGAQEPSCTGWRWSVEPLQGKRTEQAGFYSPICEWRNYHTDLLESVSIAPDIFFVNTIWSIKQFATSQHSGSEWLFALFFSWLLSGW